MKRKGMAACAVLAVLLAVSVLQIAHANTPPPQQESESGELRIELINYSSTVERGQIYKLFVYGSYSDIDNLLFSCNSEESSVQSVWLESDYCAEGMLSVGNWESNETIQIKVVDTGTNAVGLLDVTVDGNETVASDGPVKMLC